MCFGSVATAAVRHRPALSRSEPATAPSLGPLWRACRVTFATAEDLAAHLARLLAGSGGTGGGSAELKRLRQGAERWAKVGWAANWQENALPLFS